MRTLVYGLGESGVAAVRALLERGENVLAADASDEERLRRSLAELGVEGSLGAGPEILYGADRVVVSSGPRTPYCAAQKSEASLWSPKSGWVSSCSVKGRGRCV